MPRTRLIGPRKPGEDAAAAAPRKPSRKKPAKAPPEMKIEWWAIEKVIPYHRNARKNDKAVDAVAESIKRYGWQQPIVVDRAGVIIVGHTRLKAAIKLGLTQVPVLVSDMPEDKARQYRLADNKTHDLAEWDDEILALEIADMMPADLTAVGFDEVELAELRGEEVQKKGKGGGDAGDGPVDAATKYCVVIETTSEKAQQALYERFKAEKLKCRVLTY